MDDKLNKILVEIGNMAIKALKESLVKHDKHVSGNLSQSIIALPVRVLGQSLILEISMDDYWKFVDKGVDGWNRSVGSPYKFKKSRGMNITAMLKHIAARGDRYQPVVNKMIAEKRRKPLSSVKARQNLAFALGYNIKKKGIKPTHFATDVFKGIQSKGEKMMLEQMGKVIEIEIQLVVQHGNNNK